MIEGLFLDGVCVGCDYLPVDMGIELAFLVLPDPAYSEFRGSNPAAVAAEVASHVLLFQSTVKHGFFDHGLLFYLIDFDKVAIRVFGFRVKIPIWWQAMFIFISPRIRNP